MLNTTNHPFAEVATVRSLDVESTRRHENEGVPSPPDLPRSSFTLPRFHSTKFPRSCGRRKWTSTASRAPSPNGSHYRALTAPLSPGKRPRKGCEHRSGSPGARSPSRAATARSGNTRRECGEAGASRWMDEDGGIGGRTGGEVSGDDGVVTLEEAVADFDVALRDHRSKRRGLGSISGGATVISSSVNQGEQTSGGMGSPLHNTEASNWLDGEAMSWATVDLEIDSDPREWCPQGKQENEIPSEAGSNTSRGGTSMPLAAPATRSARPPPHTPPTHDDANVSDITPQSDSIQQAVREDELARIPECSSSSRSPPLPQGVEGAAKGDGVLIASGSPAATRDPGDSRPSTPPASTRVGPLGVKPWAAVAAVAEGAVSSGELLLTEPSSLLPSSPSMTGRVVNAEVGIVTQENIVEVKVDTKADPPKEQMQDAASANRATPTAAGGKETKQISLGSPPAAAAAAAVPREHGVALNAAVGDIPATVPASEPPEALVPAITGESDTTPVAAAAATVVAPQTSLAMECPDPVATVEQRAAGDWTEGVGDSSGRHQLPAPLAIAEAEAELAEKVDRLQSKRLAAERRERESLEESRAVKFGQERAARVKGFAAEDKKALAAEERRLAELRREADLGRLQLGAEFQEADEALGVRAAASSATTGATPMPVRGMRPQHFAAQEDLPEAIKKTLDRPADKVLDEMEELEARAKAAGGGMKLEAFERVEQRQRARQVERMEILLGQTAEEKSATMLMMAVRLQMFARQRVARMRVARLRLARSSSKGQVSWGYFVSVTASCVSCLVSRASLAER